MNKLDPRVDANPSAAATTGQTSTLPTRGADPVPETKTDQKSHHLGRNAAVAGVVGGAAYEADKHYKHDKDLTQAERDAKREHKHELKEEKRENKDHHYGRDAAVAGGVGGAAYEADKHHRKNELREPNTLSNIGNPAVTGQPTTTTTAGPHSSGIANKADPTADSDHPKEHHYGRDAAIAGGVGGVAYEADKHHKHDKDLTQSERDAKKEHKHELKEEKKEHKENKGGLLGFLRKHPSITRLWLPSLLTTD